MQQTASPPRGLRVELRLERFNELTGDLKLASDMQIADRMGLDRAAIYRVRNGDGSPGVRFIAAALTAFQVKFEDLFEVAGTS